MAQPVVDPNWASDTNFASGPEIGTPTKIDPGAGVLAQGYVPDERFKAQRTNYVLYWLCQWAAYLKGLASDATFLAIAFVWTSLHRFTAGLRASTIQLITGGSVSYTDAAGVAAPVLRVRSIPLRLTPTNPAANDWYLTLGGSAVSSGAGVAFIPIGQDVLPQSVELTLFRAWGDDNGTPYTGEFGYTPITHASGVAGAFNVLATGTSAGAGLSDFVEQILSHTVDHTSNRYAFKVTGTVAAQTISDAYVTFNDPGFVGN